MNQNEERKWSWMDVLGLILGFLAAILSFFGGSFTYLSQLNNGEVTLWPLPGMILLDWVVVGVLVFFAAFFILRRRSKVWLLLTWVFTGSFIPLIILGAFSIGYMVLITFLFSLIATALMAFRKGINWLESFGALMIGSIGNLAILMLIITLSGQTL
jgi:hypothetical protein